MVNYHGLSIYTQHNKMRECHAACNRKKKPPAGLGGVQREENDEELSRVETQQ